MRPLHLQTSAYGRNALHGYTSKNSSERHALLDSPNEKRVPKQAEPTTGNTLSGALAIGFSAAAVALLLCLLTGALPGIAQSLLVSSLIGLTAFCLGLAFAKGSN